MSSVKTICIETNFSRYFHKELKDCTLVNLNDAKVLIENSTDGSFFITLDLFYDRINDFLNHVKKHSSKKVVLSLKPGRVRRFYRRFLGDPLYSLVNMDYVVGVFLDKTGSIEDSVKRVNVKLRFDDLLRVLSIKSPNILGYVIVRATRLIKFLIVGLSGYVVNLLSAYGLRNILTRFFNFDLATMFASALAIEFSITWNYVWHELWTFSDVERKRRFLSYFLRWINYNFGSLGSILAQLSSVYLLTVMYGEPLYLSLTIGVILGFAINYTYSKTIVWRRKGG